jgi:hypothetical protein
MRASYTRIFKLAAPLLLLSATASAHFTIIDPPPASTAKDGKGDPPCGPGMSSSVITAVQGGHEIDLVVDETVNHPGFYRVALALEDASELPPDNTVYDSNGKVLAPEGPGNSDHADYQMTPVFPVLADNLFPHDQVAPAKYTGKVKLPNVNCDKCILQVIEFMAQHGSNGPKAGYFYHNCANLKITADPAQPIFNPNGGAGGTGGAGGAAGGTGGAAAGASAGGVGGASTAGAGGSSGGAPGSTMAGTGSTTAGAGSAIAGATAGGVSAGGAPANAGSPSTAGAPTGTAGAATTTPPSSDDSGCGVARGSRGAASAWAALGLVLALGRRRRAPLLTKRLGRSRPR